MKKRKNILDIWRSVYSYVIPAVIIIMILIYTSVRGIEVSALCKGKYYDDMLSSIITCLSIVISVFGFLIPAIMGKDSEMIKYFFENADTEKFSKNIKNVVLSGIVEILLTAILFLFDILNEITLNILLSVWIVVLAYFSCKAYRFISIMIGLLLNNKDKSNETRQVADELSKEDVENFNNKIRKIQVK